MRAPSVKSLLADFPRLNKNQAHLIRALAKAAEESGGATLDKLVEEHVPETARYVRQLYSSPWNSQMWRTTVALHAMDQIMGTYGVEPLGPVAVSGPPYEYLNTGDSYAATLVYRKKTDTLFISDWGTLAEKHPNW